MIVKDIMQTDIEKVDASINIKEAASRMSEKKIGCLLVVKELEND